MKYLRTFGSHAEYEAASQGLPTPAVVYDREEMHYASSKKLYAMTALVFANDGQTLTVLNANN